MKVFVVLVGWVGKLVGIVYEVLVIVVMCRFMVGLFVLVVKIIGDVIVIGKMLLMEDFVFEVGLLVVFMIFGVLGDNVKKSFINDKLLKSIF